jgi:hypothetical protein
MPCQTGADSTAALWVKSCGNDEECKKRCPVAVGLVGIESGFYPNSQSQDWNPPSAGAKGLLQLDLRNDNVQKKGGLSYLNGIGKEPSEQMNMAKEITKNGADWSLWASCNKKANAGGIGGYTVPKSGSTDSAYSMAKQYGLPACKKATGKNDTYFNYKDCCSQDPSCKGN